MQICYVGRFLFMVITDLLKEGRPAFGNTAAQPDALVTYSTSLESSRRALAS